MTQSAPRPQSLDELIALALALPVEAQAVLHTRLRDNLLHEGFEEEADDRRLRAQREALDGMRQVAKEQGLAEGEPPKTTGFDVTAEKLGLPWTVRKVGLAYGRWSYATQHYRTGRVPQGARVTTHRRAMRDVQRDGLRRHLDRVSRWLQDTDPPHTRKTYSEYRTAENRRLRNTNEPLLVDWRELTRYMPEATREDIFAAAKDPGLDIVAMCQRRAEERLSAEPNVLRVLSLVTAATLVGRAMVNAHDELGRPGAPTPVVRLVQTVAYLEEDVREWHRSGDVAPREPMFLQDRVWHANDMTRFLEMSNQQLAAAAARGSWYRVPPPDGIVAGGDRYWLRERYARWANDRPLQAAVRNGQWTPASLDE